MQRACATARACNSQQAQGANPIRLRLRMSKNREKQRIFPTLGHPCGAFPYRTARLWAFSPSPPAQIKTPPLGGGVCRHGRFRPVQCQILARASSSASVISPCGYRPSSRRRGSVVLTLMPPGCFNHCASVFSESCWTFRRNSALSPAAFVSTRNPQAVSGQFT